MSDPRAVSLSHRLRNLAEAEGVPARRVRNRYVFQRVLIRLSRDRRWVLKGGFGLELRLGLAARPTKDLDLLRWASEGLGATGLQDLLDEALETPADDDCTFVVRLPRQVRSEDEAPSTWRVVVDVLVGGQPFEVVTIDVVTRAAEPEQGLDSVLVHPVLGGEAFAVCSVDLARHAAEKAHAYARIYAHDRPSSRVKDLIDLALLIERGLLVPAEFARAATIVFAERDAVPPPIDLPDPPGAWLADYAAMADALGLDSRSAIVAAALVRDFYQTSLQTLDDKDEP